jgi:hypothetical protein
MQGPKVGERFIIIGGGKPFRVSPVGRFPYSEKLKVTVIAAVAKARATKQEREGKWKAAQAKKTADMAAWRAETTDADLVAMAKKADLVAVWTPNQPVELLKGKRRVPYANDVYFVSPNLPARVKKLVEYDAVECLIFCMEDGMAHSTNSGFQYPLVPGGVVKADARALRVVRRALAKAPPAKAKPFCAVAVMGHLTDRSTDKNRALKKTVAAVVRSSSRGRCSVASGFGFMPEITEQQAIRAFENRYRGVDLALVIKLMPGDAGPVVNVFGLRRREGALGVVVRIGGVPLADWETEGSRLLDSLLAKD